MAGAGPFFCRVGSQCRVGRRRKMRPRIWLQSGTRFPVGPQVENASRNWAPKWDAVSQRGCSGKFRPIFRPQSGTRFPVELPAESVSQFSAPKWDALSGSASGGKCVPESIFKLGCAFPARLQAESTSRFWQRANKASQETSTYHVIASYIISSYNIASYNVEDRRCAHVYRQNNGDVRAQSALQLRFL